MTIIVMHVYLLNLESIGQLNPQEKRDQLADTCLTLSPNRVQEGLPPMRKSLSTL